MNENKALTKQKSPHPTTYTAGRGD